VGYLNNTHPVSSNHNHSQIRPSVEGMVTYTQSGFHRSAATNRKQTNENLNAFRLYL
jgi:hypothetical protein